MSAALSPAGHRAMICAADDLGRLVRGLQR
jgi:hypothetical protein